MLLSLVVDPIFAVKVFLVIAMTLTGLALKTMLLTGIFSLELNKLIFVFLLKAILSPIDIGLV